MQKKLIVLAVAGLVSSGAFAADNVTLYGSFDAGLRNLSNSNGAGQSLTTMASNGTFNSNRLGFTGKEDLGNGLNAHFDLETGFNSGTGATDTNNVGNFWNRTASLGLGGSWGSLDLGNQYTAIFHTVAAYDPFHYKYVGIIPMAGLDGARRNNDIQYTGNFGAVTARVEHAVGQVPGSTAAGATTEGGLSYAAGGLSLGTAYGTQKDPTGQLTTKNWTVGGAYKTGPFEVAAGYDKKTADKLVGNAGDTKNWWLGGSYSMTQAAALVVGYYDTKTTNVLAIDGQQKLSIVGATYALSKRTTFYADIDHKNLDGSLVVGYGGAQTQGNQTGVSVGINHAF